MPTRAGLPHPRTAPGWRHALCAGAVSVAFGLNAAAQAQDRDIERRIEQRIRYTDPMLEEADAAKSFA